MPHPEVEAWVWNCKDVGRFARLPTCFPLGLLLMSLSWCERDCCLVSRQPPAWCLIIAGSHCSTGAWACCPFQQHFAKPIASILHTGSRPHPPNYIQYLVTAHSLERSQLRQGCRSDAGLSLQTFLRKLHQLRLLLSIVLKWHLEWNSTVILFLILL